MSKKIDYEGDLNEEQLAPVTAGGGPMLVIAAAGTGKTRTITYRVAFLVENGVDPRNILLLTFTNKAANEMLDRARAIVGDMVSGLWGGTFHHMANRILRRHARVLGYNPDYTIIDREDSKKLLRACVSELELRDKHFPKPEVLLSIFALADNSNKEVAVLAEDRFGQGLVDPKDVVAVRKLYQSKKMDMNAMDFDDLLLNVWRLLKQDQGILSHYRQRFEYIMVDEYQDTNPIQSEIVDLLAGHHGNLMVVGDDFQSIYSWRGADFRNIITFPERYPEATTYKLETNYRSVPEVLDVANACIRGNPDQFQKTLRAIRDRHLRPTAVFIRDGSRQADYVIDQVQSLQSQGVRMDEMAVIYRSHYHALEIQLALSRARIPFFITSGVRFFEQAHIKDCCSLLRLVNNPCDEVSFTRMLCLLPKVGEKTAAKIWKLLEGRFNPLLSEHRKLVSDRVPAPAREGWGAIDEVFEDCSHQQLREDFGEIIYRFTASFYDDYALESFENHTRRMEDIEELCSYSSKYKELKYFLSDIALISSLDAEEELGGDRDSGTLRLTTIHQAKGLEWKAVFILWLSDGMFPARRSLDSNEDEAEERRLFYVATTRAKDRLFLCSPKIHRAHKGSPQYYSPSRFLKEIPSELLDIGDVSTFAGSYL